MDLPKLAYKWNQQSVGLDRIRFKQHSYGETQVIFSTIPKTIFHLSYSVMKNLILYLTFIIGLIFMGCSHTTELIREQIPEDALAVDYTVIYYIHADSDYLYHTPDSDPVRGNSGVLTTAMEVGEAAQSGEVIIYYQRSEKRILGLFPQKGSRFYHYKNGQLVNKVKYRHPDRKEAFLTTEVQLMNKYRSQNRSHDHQNYFLYFGHEIPSESGKEYHRSLAGIDVSSATFARGIQNFLLSDEDRFAMVVLSTCNNGTPAMAELLIPFTDVMLASPQNLHLSHIDSDSMTLLEMEPGITPLQLGHSMAEQTFHRLEATIHTTITIALYNFEKVRAYINSLTSITAANTNTDRSIQFKDNVDCAELFYPDTVRYRNGVETWYKPARFGRKSGQSTHSGWGCKPGVK